MDDALYQQNSLVEGPLGLITIGLFLMFGIAILHALFVKKFEIGPRCWWACAPLATMIGNACIGWMFSYSWTADDGSKHLTAQYAICGLFFLGVILGIFAVIRASGLRLLVASVVALELWASLFVAFFAGMSVSGECF